LGFGGGEPFQIGAQGEGLGQQLIALARVPGDDPQGQRPSIITDTFSLRDKL
jgi:hypothetical protein